MNIHLKWSYIVTHGVIKICHVAYSLYFGKRSNEYLFELLGR